ncbi:MAG TPA: hypothetical protein DCZ75_03630 [Geobacter sp.]|nr:hypothetical protein [Geobacter sp.]
MKQRDGIRIVWSRTYVAAAGSGETGASAPRAATPPAEVTADPLSQRRALSRSRTLWGREDGFTMSAARRLP